jgi:tetratricopeptide (TPR) repeat protein
MRFVLVAAIGSALWTTGGCARTAVQHSYGLSDYFTGLKNYQWRSPSALALSKQDALVDKNVQFIADQELKLKGYNRSSEKPDFEISVHYTQDIEAPYSYKLKMLTLNVYRMEDHAVLWRGTASGTIKINATSSDLEKAVQKILSNFPDSNATDVQLSDLGYHYFQQGDYAEAEKYLDRALFQNSNNAYAILTMGAVYQNTGRSDKARETYEKLIALNPPDVAVLSNQSGVAGKSLVEIAKENLKILK